MDVHSPAKVVRLYLDQFKMFKDLVLEFVPGLNILIGPNACGKTSVLQAFDFLRFFATGGERDFFSKYHMTPDHLRHFDLPLLKLGLLLQRGEQFCFWILHWNTESRFVEHEEIRLGKSPNALKPIWVYRQGLLAFGEKGREMQKEMVDFNFRNSLMDTTTMIGTSQSAKEMILDWASGVMAFDVLDINLLAEATALGKYPAPGFQGRNYVGFLAGLAGEKHNRFEARMRAYTPAFKSLKYVKFGGHHSALFKDAHPRSGLRSLDMAGGGQRRLLFLAGIPELPSETSLVMLEEVENGIYFPVLPLVLQDLNETDFQIFLTTYNETLFTAGQHVLNFPGDFLGQGDGRYP